MCPYQYYQIMKHSKDKKQWRYQMVQKALNDGIKPTARTFHTSPPSYANGLAALKPKVILDYKTDPDGPTIAPMKLLAISKNISFC